MIPTKKKPCDGGCGKLVRDYPGATVTCMKCAIQQTEQIRRKQEKRNEQTATGLDKEMGGPLQNIETELYEGLVDCPQCRKTLDEPASDETGCRNE